MGAEPVTRPAVADPAVAEYCRQVEAYLCLKNDGHLIRVVGPSFDLVSGWARRGVPVKVACRGIDRYFERYYRKGPRRRPVRVDFCEADVLDEFDRWQRAVGLASPVERRGPSLPAHLERVVARLTEGRASGTLDGRFDAVLDRVAAALEQARSDARGLRGRARGALIEGLSALDVDLLKTARAALTESDAERLKRQADEELASFRDRMAPDLLQRACEAAFDRLVREHFRLPELAFA